MITLQTTQTIYGQAAFSSSISYTITGLELVGSTENYKVLAQGQLSNSAQVLYTVPASTSCLVRQILFANTTTNRISGIKLYIGGSSNANQIVTLSIPPNGSAKFDATGWVVYDFLGIEVKDLSLASIYDDSNDPIIYLGKALPGELTSSAVWQISKINMTTGVITTWADGDSNFDNIWDNRASLTYS
jgi:hypothetical protein